MRFDDSLSTVLAADTSTAFGAQSAYRQIVDLLARRRVAVSPALLARLEELRPRVPVAARVASARGLTLATPPEPLIAFFAADEPAVAAAALRTVTLDDSGWDVLLPRIGPAGRAVLRSRTDLPASVLRALAAFGPVDFTIGFERGESAAPADPVPAPALPAEAPAVPAPPPPHGFPIAELVDRIAAFQRGDAAAAMDPPPTTAFAFEADRHGRVRWTDAEPRGALLGLRFDGALADAARCRVAARGVQITLPAGSALHGDWRVDGEPAFDDEGRYVGLRGVARRTDKAPAGNGEAIRRLVHELRTPMNAISGFAELMNGELLGPVAPVHRTAAGAIHADMAALISAIEDLDVAARIDGHALDLAPREVAVWPLLESHRGRVVAEGNREAVVHADPRALGRLIDRMIGLLDDGARMEVLCDAGWTTLSGPPGTVAGKTDAAPPLLGTTFTLRLIGDLAREIGGTFVAGERLTLRLPTQLDHEVRIGGVM